MSRCNAGGRISGDNLNTDITTCSIGEPQQKYRLGTVSNKLLGSVNKYYRIQKRIASFEDTPNNTTAILKREKRTLFFSLQYCNAVIWRSNR